MKKIHIVGIEGAGTSALAVLYKRRGHEVSGSDNGDHFYAPALNREGISIAGTFSPSNVPKDADEVIYSTAFEGNPEVEYAKSLGIPVRSYPEAIGEITKGSLGLLVAGTHGKTTTSALLAEVVRAAGLDPSAIIGGRVRSWGGNSLSGAGKHFVLEADEYQNKLRFYHPFAAILTSVDWDHPDFFPDEASYRSVFLDFVTRIPRHGVLIFCNDSASVVDIARHAHCASFGYGFHEGSDIRIVNHEVLFPDASNPNGPRQRFEIISKEGSLGVFELCLAGKHNALNAAAVVALSRFLKLDMESVRIAFSEFLGTERRFEYVGKRDDVLVFDDYAHHPEEIRATLSAFRALYPSRRVIAVFHPHTFSRTEALLPQFSQSFDDADRVFVLDVYGSAREKEGKVSSDDLVNGINRYASGKAENSHNIDQTVSMLESLLTGGDLVVTIGAGDVWRVAKDLVSHTNKPPISL